MRQSALSRPSRRGVLILAASSALGVSRPAAGSEIHTGLLSSIAAGGYDVVAYFTEGRPVPGNASFEHVWRGATWRFASATARDAFAADPQRYAPAYGGHCAWAASQGYRASGSPHAWRIVAGRLFFNYDARVHRRWEDNIAGFVESADRNWPTLARQ